MDGGQAQRVRRCGDRGCGRSRTAASRASTASTSRRSSSSRTWSPQRGQGGINDVLARDGPHAAASTRRSRRSTAATSPATGRGVARPAAPAPRALTARPRGSADGQLERQARDRPAVAERRRPAQERRRARARARATRRPRPAAPCSSLEEALRAPASRPPQRRARQARLARARSRPRRRGRPSGRRARGRAPPGPSTRGPARPPRSRSVVRLRPSDGLGHERVVERAVEAAHALALRRRPTGRSRRTAARSGPRCTTSSERPSFVVEALAG